METRNQAVKVTKILHSGHEFKSLQQFPPGFLPTTKQVICRVLNEVNFLKSEAANTVAQELVQLWTWCNVYTISISSVVRKIQELIKEFSTLDRYPKAKRGTTFLKKEAIFVEKLDHLFDIFCEDKRQRRILEAAHGLRMCSKDYEFYNNQKTTRISKCTSVLEKLTPSDVKFKQKHLYSEAPTTSKISRLDSDAVANTDIATLSDDQSVSAASQCPSENSLAQIDEEDLQQNRSRWPNLALICDRYLISDRAGAAVANAVMKDLNSNGLLIKYDKSLSVDRSKLRRERGKYREDARMEDDALFLKVDGIYIDGRKDATQVMVNKEDKCYRKTIVEEHYVVVGEPGAFYLTHVSPPDGKERSIAQTIFDKIKDTSLQDNLAAVGSDGTAVMTGAHNGAIRNLEELCKKSVQWSICLLHCNELPLRHLFQTLDGTTSSPDSFSGPVGKSLKGCVSEWGIAEFVAISSPDLPILSEDLVDSLSSDQYYAYKICRAITKGYVEADLALLEIGPVVHSRWLTIACRILRLYVSKVHPTNTLETLARFCMQIYFPTWFQIKSKSNITDGPKNLYDLYQRIQVFPDSQVKDIATKVVERNAYFAHPENIMLAMLADENEEIRNAAVKKIVFLRNKASESAQSTNIRHFKVPKINPTSKSYHELANLDESDVEEPPLVRHFSLSEIEDLKSMPLQISHPCHNQAVERHIQLVSEVSALVTGFENRDGIIRQRIKPGI